MGVPHGVGTSWHLLPWVETPDRAGCLSKTFSFGQKGILGAMMSLQAEDSQKKKSRIKTQPWP